MIGITTNRDLQLPDEHRIGGGSIAGTVRRRSGRCTGRRADLCGSLTATSLLA
jgi:hypothetical protein